MLKLLILTGRGLALVFWGHQELVLENLALRQQLMAVTRTVQCPRLRAADRRFWTVLARIWRNWRTASVLVQPDTVASRLASPGLDSTLTPARRPSTR